MKNLIYQNWTGQMRPGAKHSEKLFREYAKRIGCEYRLDLDPNTASRHTDVALYYEFMNFMFDDSFLEYDNVCIVDMDVFPTTNLSESIFDEFIESGAKFGICDEPFQGKYRTTVTIGSGINNKSDEIWNRAMVNKYGTPMPRDADGYLKVYNTGVVVVSKEGMLKAREEFAPFQEYVDTVRRAGLGKFYTIDQNYFHAMICTHGEYVELDNDWNCYVHYVRGPLGQFEPIHDGRGKDPKFVHIQLSGADHFDNDKLDRITNLQMSEWML